MAWIIQEDYPIGTPLNSCYICKTGRRYPGERLLDPSLNIDFEGWLVICEECIAEAARMLGMISTAQAAKLQDQLDDAKTAVESYKEDAEEALNVAKAATRARVRAEKRAVSA